MTNPKIKKIMNKKGFIDGFSLVVFLVVVSSVIGGTYSLTQSQKSQSELYGYYVGDVSTLKAYAYDCYTKIPESQRVYFNSLDVARQFKYNVSVGGCPK